MVGGGWKKPGFYLLSWYTGPPPHPGHRGEVTPTAREATSPQARLCKRDNQAPSSWRTQSLARWVGGACDLPEPLSTAARPREDGQSPPPSSGTEGGWRGARGVSRKGRELRLP